MVFHHQSRGLASLAFAERMRGFVQLSQRRRRLAAGVCLLSLAVSSNFGLGVSNALADCLQSCGGGQAPSDLWVDEGTKTLSDEDLGVSTLTVGSASAANLIIKESAALVSANATIGTEALGAGSVELTGAGSSWSNSSELTIGIYGGTGKVTVSDGAALTASRLALSTGSWEQGAGGTGTLEVSGQGTVWTNTGGVDVARTEGSTGSLTISDGAEAYIRNIGIYAGAGASITITGDETHVEIGNPEDEAEAAWLSPEGGSVDVADGAYLYASGIYVGSGGENPTTMTVSGSGTVVDTKHRIYVGGQNGSRDVDPMNGNGFLQISDGAQVSSATVGAGMDPRSFGLVHVTGEGSQLAARENADLGAAGNIYVGYAGTGVIGVSDGAVLEADGQIRIATVEGATGVLVIGGLIGSPLAAGTVLADEVVFGDGEGQIVFNHTSTDYEFAAALSGSGLLTAAAGTTILTGDSGDFTGTIDVLGGTLDMQGANNATAVVRSGATLTGDGTVGSIDARANSVIAPGNSPGKLRVNGDYKQAAGSIYRAELAPGVVDVLQNVSNRAAPAKSNDLISIDGEATLEPGAILDVVKYGTDRYRLDASYMILTADEGVTGVFDVQGDTRVSQFYDLLADYQDHAVSLISTQTSSFESAALTFNQFAVAETLQAMDPKADLREAVGIVQSAEDARLAFDQLSGEVHASAKATLLDDSRFLREAVGRQMSTGPAVEGPSFWTQAYGSWANLDSDGNGASIDRNGGGFFVGAEGDLAEAMRLGFVGGYGNTSLNLSEGRGSASIDNYSLGIYGQGTWDRLNLTLGAAQTWHELGTERRASFDTFEDQLSADYKGRTAQVFAELGYTLETGEASFEPFVGLAYVNTDTDAFTEEGGVAALSGAASDVDATYSTVGLRSSTRFDVAGLAMEASGTVGWRHNFSDTNVGSVHGFDMSNSFTVASASSDRDVGFIEAGLRADLGSSAALSISYSGQFGKEINDSGVKLRFDVNY